MSQNLAAETLEAAAATLLLRARELRGDSAVPSGFDPANPATWWPALQEQFERDKLPHPYVAPGTGVLPSQTGTNEQPPRSYDSHRMLWEAAQRGDPLAPGEQRIFTNGAPGWPDAKGRPFRIDDHIPEGPEAIHAAIAHLYVSECGQRWLASVGEAFPPLKRQPTRW